MTIKLTPDFVCAFPPVQAFSKTGSDIKNVVMVASIIIILAMAVIVYFIVKVAHSVSEGLTKPVNQLVETLKGLNNLELAHEVRFHSLSAFLVMASKKNSNITKQKTQYFFKLPALPRHEATEAWIKCVWLNTDLV